MTPLQALTAGLIPLVVAVLLLAGLAHALHHSGADAAHHRRTLLGAALLMAAWLGLTGALAAGGVFADFAARPPRLMLAVLPALVAAALLARSGAAGQMLARVPAWQPVALQAFRLPLEGLLFWGFASGVVPVQMTFEGLNFDVLTGLSAPLVAYGLFRRRLPLGAAVAFNALGIGLLFTVLTIAILSAPGPLRVFTNEPANTVAATFPFVWTPVFLIPVAFFLHLVSLRQLLGARRVAAPQAGPELHLA